MATIFFNEFTEDCPKEQREESKRVIAQIVFIGAKNSNLDIIWKSDRYGFHGWYDRYFYVAVAMFDHEIVYIGNDLWGENYEAPVRPA